VTGANRRTIERWTAAAIALFGGVVAAESLTHDIGWNDNGPGAGYFPFRVGLLLVAAALVLLLQHRRAAPPSVFVTGDQLRRTLSIFGPTAALVAAMFPLGCYVPSAAYLAWMMRRHGGYTWRRAVVLGVTVMAGFFLVFDLWFRVPLAKGPLEAALGLY
jgi:ABC-type Fe3+-siderophore transport system permease subunit